uniref:SMP-30/Gluconolactonase/LRE-like region domain-containing protein n=1 Tax=Rhizochromulina marina TaxID=1034831 RepID=A0A7S2SI56_9STRA|mmetsp:Transcript_30583/g.88861  ORF Transcript_30583/g.88861 Transcript_30583/m.88861 type:complete len:286 (+) Transcript_30583:115-972(+)
MAAAAAAASLEASPVVTGMGPGICSPFFDANGTLHFASSMSGDIFAADISAGRAEKVTNSGGGVTGAAVDASGSLYLADPAQNAVLCVAAGDVKVVCASYEDRPFRGPHSVAFDSKGGMFFTDSGPLGETGLHNPKGSVYAVAQGPDGSYLKPLISESLAHPAGVAVSPDDRCIYVCEMMSNRILRLCQKPKGVYHASVFYQFSGGMGPSSVAVAPTGDVIVGLFDFNGLQRSGKVLCLGVDGSIQAEVHVPGPEVTGVAVSPNGRELYITEASTGALLFAPLSS